MINNVLLKIVRILVLIAGLLLLGILFYNIFFVQLAMKSIVIRSIAGIIGIVIWIRYLIYVIRKFKKYF